MNKKRLVVYAIVLAVLAALVYLQFRQWRNFDWHQFFEDVRYVAWRDVVHALILVFVVYVLRAVRWKLFLGPDRKDISTLNLLSPTVVGFTALALLGRAGEVIRPYLIARRTSTSLSSQLAVWTVERIFDIAAFTVLMVSAIFLPTQLREFAMQRPEVYRWLHLTGYVLTALVLVLFCGALLINFRGPAIANWIEARSAHSAGKLAHRIAQRIREFAAGLRTIHGPASFLMISAVSLLMWWIIAVSYKEVAHAYGAPMREMSSSSVLLLMGSSMVGSMVQLPGVGGGSQLATIEALDKIFHVPRELAVSCGILLWLVTFVAIVPFGLALARYEGISLVKVSEESEKEEAETVIP
ncbi:MAG TPA: lysylphosphatidylglycerol synthase transmembrane domain-containing protein [Terriglobales bacterium]